MGSGETPYQHSGDFLSRVEKYKAEGMSEGEILKAINDTLPPEYQLGATEFRVAKTKAGHDRKAQQWDDIQKLKKENPNMGWTEIGQKLGLPESTVRSMYKNGVGTKKDQAEKIAETLKKEVDKKGMVDVSEGTNLTLGVSEGKMDEAIYILEAEHGYKRYGVGIKQPTNFVSRPTSLFWQSLNTIRIMPISIRVTFSLWVTIILMTAAVHFVSCSLPQA